MHVEVELSGRKHIASDRTRLSSGDARDLSFQDCVRVFLVANPESAVLLELLDHSASSKHLDARDQRFIFESRYGDGVHILQVIWLYRPNVIAETTGETATDNNRREKILHGAGEAPSSAGADGSGVAAGAGAVVLSGKSEAGGGSEGSVSGGGNGAKPSAADSFLAGSFSPGFFFAGACSAAAKAGLKTASPSFARNSSILFLAFSLSPEPGC